MCMLNCYLCPSIVYVLNLNTYYYYNYGYVGKHYRTSYNSMEHMISLQKEHNFYHEIIADERSRAKLLQKQLEEFARSRYM